MQEWPMMKINRSKTEASEKRLVQDGSPKPVPFFALSADEHEEQPPQGDRC